MRVVAAAGAERGDRALVVAAGEAERVPRQLRVVQLGLGEVGHSATASGKGTTLSAERAVGDGRADEARGDRRAVVVEDGDQAGRIDIALRHEQRAQLGVAVLLDHEDLVVPRR